MTDTFNPLFDKQSWQLFCWGAYPPGLHPCGNIIVERRLMSISERSMSICGKQRENRYLNKTSAEARQRHGNGC